LKDRVAQQFLLRCWFCWFCCCCCCWCEHATAATSRRHVMLVHDAYAHWLLVLLLTCVTAAAGAQQQLHVLDRSRCGKECDHGGCHTRGAGRGRSAHHSIR
jgi:hypothetical protein